MEHVPREVFFPDTTDNRRAKANTAIAKTYCNRCPVERKCRQYALDNYEVGIWGGTTDREREFHRRGIRLIA